MSGRLWSAREMAKETWRDLLRAAEHGPAMRPRYHPPYASPIEDAFARLFTRRAGADVVFDAQVRCSTSHGDYRFDFTAQHRGRTVAIECDGRAHHDPLRDVFRDAIVLAGGHMNAVVRIPGAAIWNEEEDVLWVLRRWEPRLIRVAEIPSDALRETAHARSESIAWIGTPSSNESASHDERRWCVMTRRWRGMFDRRDIDDLPTLAEADVFASSNPSASAHTLANLYRAAQGERR